GDRCRERVDVVGVGAEHERERGGRCMAERLADGLVSGAMGVTRSADSDVKQHGNFLSWTSHPRALVDGAGEAVRCARAAGLTGSSGPGRPSRRRREKLPWLTSAR